MDAELPEGYFEPSPGPWAFHDYIYEMRHLVIDRDGRHLCSHVKYGNGRLMAAAPAMADVLQDLVNGVATEDLRERAKQLLDLIGPHRSREPGEDDE